MGKSYLPPGFRFNPTDVELIKYYLKRKIMGKRIRVKVVAEVDIYKFSPWDLPEKSCWRSGDLKWYFFSPREKKYASGARVNRATECGYWKTTGKDRSVLYNGEVVGWIKTLIFHTGRPPKGERTNWVLHEYRLEEKNLVNTVTQDSFVLCMVFQKDGIGPRNNTQYGAPFKEKDWSDDEVETDAVPHVNMLEQDLVHANMKDPDPLPDHVFWNLPEPELVNPNTPECDLVTAGTPEPNHVYENVPDPYLNVSQPDLVYPNMPQPDLVYPSMPQPDLFYPSMPKPDHAYPSMPQPDHAYPSMPQPDLVYPSMPQPDLVYPSMPQPDLVYPCMPQPDLVYSNRREPYLDFGSNCNSSVATRTNSLQPCVSDIVPPSSNVLLSASPDDDILLMLDCFTEEETFVMSDIHKNQGLDNIIYSGSTHPAADFRDLGKEKYNFSSGHNSFDTADQMPSVDDAFLELFDLQKPLNGNNSLSTLNLPMFSPHRTLLDELLDEPAPDGGYFLSKDG